MPKPLFKEETETYLARYADCGLLIEVLAESLLSLPEPELAGADHVRVVTEIHLLLQAATEMVSESLNSREGEFPWKPKRKHRSRSELSASSVEG